jgi:predicted amidohydrolase YtcJ
MCIVREGDEKMNRYKVFQNRILFRLIILLALSVTACNIPQMATNNPLPTNSPEPTENSTPVRTNTATPTSTHTPTVPTEPADIIFHNGAIITIEESQPVAEAIAIRGELILAVGTNQEILALRGPDTTVIDLQGRAVLPGFIEGHAHLLAFPDRKGQTMDQAQDIALRYGLTTVNEMWADEAFLNRLFQAEEQGDLRIRVNVFASYNDGVLDGNRQKVFLKAWYPGHDPILDPQRRVRIPGIKIFVDGDNFRPVRGCWAFNDPVPANAWAIKNGVCGTATGDLYWKQDELNQIVRQAQNAGYRVAFHSMGESAIETTLNAIEFALDGQPNEQVRHQIEHNSMIRPDLLTRYEELDILASVRGYGDFCDLKQFIPDFGPERINWYANRYALPGLDIHSYMESDFGWTVDPEARYDQRSLDPIMQLYGIVTHNLESANGTLCGPDPVVAKFVISVEKALEMMTIEPAYAVSMEDYIGSLKPGKYADLIILSDSPLAVDPDDLKNLKVQMTMVNGKAEYCTAGYESLCHGQISQKANSLPKGFHDATEGEQSRSGCLADGWAADPDDRNLDLKVRILVDGAEIIQTTASKFRQDLKDAGECPGGTCGFSIDLWKLISHNTEHSVLIQAQDAQTGEWVNLNKTPKTLNCIGQ